MSPPSEMFSDENDIEKNNGQEGSTFLLDDDDECVIEDADDEDSDEDSVEHREAMGKLYSDNPDGNDSDNEGVHDQLPSVEEVKASNAYLPTARIHTNRHRRKLYLIIAAAAFAAMVLSVSISVGVFKRTGAKKNTEVSIEENPRVPNPDLMGSLENYEMSNATPEEQRRFEEIISYIFSFNIFDLPILELKGTAEHHAVMFMTKDKLKLPMSDVSTDRRRFLERYILASFFYKTGGEKWKSRLHFMTRYDHCQWNAEYSMPEGRFLKGIQCDENGFVVDIDLSHNNLNAAYLPKEIAHIEGVERLHLFGENTIGGTLPKELKMMKNLKSLGLMDLGIHGELPSFLGEMTSLTTLALSNTKISGVIPDNFAKLHQMRVLGLDGLGMVGRLNPILRLTKLEGLYLEDNLFSGQIFSNDWKAMKEIDISNNIITGYIPDNLFENENLRVLDLHGCLFHGDFPKHLMTTSLEYLALQHNGLSGSLSDRIGYMFNLKHVDVSFNALTGTIPDTLQLLTSMVSLHTTGNKFSPQPLVDYYSGMTNLKEISMKGNQFTGTLPEFFSKMTKLQMLDLDGNKLRGEIPTSYRKLTDLYVLQLNRNQLSGTIPSELADLKKLQVLLLDNNNLHGRTTALCKLDSAGIGQNWAHFTSDCYPSQSGGGPEVDCRCCTQCCNDDDSECNKADWTSNYDPKAKYGFIRPAYSFSLDKADEGWQAAVMEESATPNGNY